MERLQSIVWPEIRQLAQKRIASLGKQGVDSVVLEAAVLLEAGWDDMCDELWVVQVPPDVARYVRPADRGMRSLLTQEYRSACSAFVAIYCSGRTGTQGHAAFRWTVRATQR